jgi:hypothetical protein
VVADWSLWKSLKCLFKWQRKKPFKIVLKRNSRRTLLKALLKGFLKVVRRLFYGYPLSATSRAVLAGLLGRKHRRYLLWVLSR